MKLLFGLVLAILIFVAVAERASVALAPMDWTTIAPLGGLQPVATKKDLLVYPDSSAASGSTNNAKRDTSGMSLENLVMAVRRRNAEGVYEFVGNFTEGVSAYAVTNGKWVAMYGVNGNNGFGFFKVDENNTFSSLSTIDANLYGGFILSDDTFVSFDTVSPLDDGNFTIRTYQYEASNNTWQEIPEAGLVIAHEVSWQGDVSTYRVSDTHLVVLDPTNSSSLVVNIYERQADKSWKYIESVPVNSTSILSLNFNNVDTLAVFAPIADDSGLAVGVVFVYTKSNGKWVEQKFSTTSVGFKPLGYFGLFITFTDANHLLVAAPYERFTGSGQFKEAGRLVLIARNDDGVWEPLVDLTGDGVFGLGGIGFNDYDIIAPSIFVDPATTIVYNTIPLCFYQPINVTCSNQQVSSCSQVDLTSLYTVNNPQCGAVSATLGGFGLVNNEAIQAQLSFTKGYGATVMCNATVSCPVPPIAVQQTPSKVSSSVVGVQFGLVSVFGFVSFLLM